MGRATKLKQLRKKAREATSHLDAESYRHTNAMTKTLGECTKGAYKALKAGSVKIASSQ